MTINFDPKATTNVNDSINNSNNLTNNQEGVTTMTTLTVREELNFKSKAEIISEIKTITDDEFLTMNKWEYDAIKSILAGKATADQVVTRIGDAQTSNVFDNFLNNVIVVTTITPKADLFTMIDKEANKKPATAVVGNFIGNLVRSSVKGSADVLSAAKATYKATKGGNVTNTTKSPKF